MIFTSNWPRFWEFRVKRRSPQVQPRRMGNIGSRGRRVGAGQRENIYNFAETGIETVVVTADGFADQGIPSQKKWVRRQPDGQHRTTACAISNAQVNIPISAARGASGSMKSFLRCGKMAACNAFWIAGSASTTEISAPWPLAYARRSLTTRAGSTPVSFASSP